MIFYFLIAMLIGTLYEFGNPTIYAELSNLDRNPIVYLNHTGPLQDSPGQILFPDQTENYVFTQSGCYVSGKVFYQTAYPDDLEIAVYYDIFGKEYYGITASKHFETTVEMHPGQRVTFSIRSV